MDIISFLTLFFSLKFYFNYLSKVIIVILSPIIKHIKIQIQYSVIGLKSSIVLQVLILFSIILKKNDY